MVKVFNDAKDLQVRAVYVYAKADDAYAYLDSEKTVKVDAAVLEDLFVKGLLMVDDGGAKCQPVSFDIVSTVGTVSYFKGTNTIATLKSKEYTA